MPLSRSETHSSTPVQRHSFLAGQQTLYKSGHEKLRTLSRFTLLQLPQLEKQQGVCVCVCAGALTWHVSALWPKRGMLVRFQVTVNWRQWETTSNNGWYTYRCAGHWKEKEKKDPAWFCNRASGKKFDCGLETRRFLDLFPQPHLVLGTDSLMPGSWVVLTAAPVWQNYTIRVITVTKR